MSSPHTPSSPHMPAAGAVAIIGWAGRFPGAQSVEQLWENLRAGREAIRFFSDEELRAAGVSEQLLADPRYVKAKGTVDGVELFDAAFFDLTPREAELMDPQQRFALTCAWEALEDAGCDPGRFPGKIGVFAGLTFNTYLLENLATRPDLLEAVGRMQLVLQNRADHVAPRISYKLDLRGPSVNVQSACSTSLVAVHLACQSLLGYQCDMALAGGVALRFPAHVGYLATEGGIASSDGHCRAFDARADGVLAGDGAALVVLRRLEDALAAGDAIRAVILGSSVNNDGAAKVGYTAPGVDGQADAIAEALAVAGVEARSISYVEAHGTGTPLGDPIEVEALTRVFRAGTRERQFCGIGSIKTNLGHLDAAAGVTGLIKTALALERGELPPTLHFERPNPRIDFAASPFYPVTRLTPWPRGRSPRRAGVSSFGFGGTNAHVVLAEPPAYKPVSPGRLWQLLPLSARTASALERATAGLAHDLEQHPERALAEVAWTLQTGRQAFSHRRIAVARTSVEAAAALGRLEPHNAATSAGEPQPRRVFFLFPGQGAQSVGMAVEVYQEHPTFRRWLDHCCALLEGELDVDLRRLIDPPPAERERAALRLAETRFTQPALFAVEYALAQVFLELGVRPAGMLGHSLGELVAACLSGVFSLEDALRLVAVRARLMQGCPTGAMLAVSASPEELAPWLGADLALAAVNQPARTVVSGPHAAVAALETVLGERTIPCRRLETSHAYHSASMEPALAAWRAELERTPRRAPRIPFISNLSGGWISPAEACSTDYWVCHLRATVRFSTGCETLFDDPEAILLEVGPGRTLANLARSHPRKPAAQQVVAALGHRRERSSEMALLLMALGRLWLAGAEVDWARLHHGEPRRRVPLPTYPFEGRRFWIEPGHGPTHAGSAARRGDPAERFYAPLWRQLLPVATRPAGETAVDWLIFADAALGAGLVRRLETRGARVVSAVAGERFERLSETRFALRPGVDEDCAALLTALAGEGRAPRRIAHLWLAPGLATALDELAVERCLELGFDSVTSLARTLGRHELACEIVAVASQLAQVTGAESLVPEKATLLGALRVIPQEYPRLSCRAVDVVPAADPARTEHLLDRLVGELEGASQEPLLALRDGGRWAPSWEPLPLGAEPPGASLRPLRTGGVYLITGGLGGLGLEVAALLAERARARLVLVGRSTSPGSEEHARQAVDRLETLGAEVQVAPADVADREQMARVLAAARARFGRIDGVVHAAGVPGSGTIERSSRAAARAVLAPKLAGTRVLDDLLAGEALDFFVLFSSRSAILGGVGQADYAAANAYLGAFAQARDDRATIAIDWNGWREVGMLARRRERGQTAGAPSGHPLLGLRLPADGSQTTWAARLDVRRCWVLDDHRILGKAVLPGVAYLEMARAALERCGEPGAVVELRDVFFASLLAFSDDQPREVRLVLEPEDEGYRFRILAQAAGGAGWREFALGRGRLLPPEPRRHDLAEILAGVGAERVVEDDYRLADENLGPRWMSLKRAHVGRREVLAELDLPAGLTGDLEEYFLHPGLLDRANGSGMEQLIGSGAYLPFGYERVIVRGRLPRRFFSHVRFRAGVPGESETLSFDIRLIDPEGRELMVSEGFTQKRVRELRLTAPTAALPASVPAGEPSLETLSPEEGIEAFRRILLGCPVPRVVVSCEHLPTLLAARRHAAPVQPPAVVATSGERPAPTAAARPVTVAQTLIEIWQEVLGLAPIGEDDNFFELGGDSVQAIQVVSRAHQRGLRLGPQLLFEHPSPGALARRLTADATTTPPTEEPTTDDDLTTGLDERSLAILMHQLEQVG